MIKSEIVNQKSKIHKIRIIAVVAGSGIAVLMAATIVLRSFIFEPMIVAGHSMSPTIMQKDRILVNKLAYRSRGPNRGDIIAFRMGWQRFVKRIVGLPGDVIAVKNGLLYRDGEAVLPEEPHGTTYPRRLSRRSYGPRAVRDRCVFVMGDNLGLSRDSRDFGTIPYQDITGKVVFIYFPPKRMRKLRPARKET